MSHKFNKKICLSVVLCTFNRAKVLKEVLSDLTHQETLEAFDYEVLVVDNNSKDETRKVVLSFENQFSGRLKYFFAPMQGKAYALNLGIKNAQGEIIVSIDDDCSLPKNYLMNIYEGLHQQPSSVKILGGRILPQWMAGAPPEWLDRIFSQPSRNADGSLNWMKINFQGPLGILDYGPKSLLIDGFQSGGDKPRFYGGNMAFRKNFFTTWGYFLTSKNVTEDTEICDRIYRLGFKALYAPQVVVYHKIFKEQYSLDFYYWYYFQRGLMMSRQMPYQHKFYHPLGVSLSLIQETLRLFVQSLNLKIDRLKRAFFLCRALFNFGQILQIAKDNIV